MFNFLVYVKSMKGMFSERTLTEEKANFYFGSIYFTIVKEISHFQVYTSAITKLKLKCCLRNGNKVTL